MSLDQDQIDILRRDLATMTRRKHKAADVFYAHLFDIAPETRALFADDIEAQTEKVMFAMGVVVAQIHDLRLCGDMLGDLARRHVGYGVRPDHYALVGEAVIRTLADVVEEDFDATAEAAWRTAYRAIANAMISAAYPKASAA